MKSYSPILKPAFLLLIIQGCSNSRYGSIQRAETRTTCKPITKPANKAEVKTLSAEPLTLQAETKSKEPAKTSIPGNPNYRNDKKKPLLFTRGIEKLNNYFIPIDTLPNDSIKININEEAGKAEKAGNIGFVIAIVLISILFLSLAIVIGFIPDVFFLSGFYFLFLALYITLFATSLIALIGLIYCIIALAKIGSYKLKVKNQGRIFAGFTINSVLLVLSLALVLLSLL